MYECVSVCCRTISVEISKFAISFQLHPRTYPALETHLGLNSRWWEVTMVSSAVPFSAPALNSAMEVISRFTVFSCPKQNKSQTKSCAAVTATSPAVDGWLAVTKISAARDI